MIWRFRAMFCWSYMLGLLVFCVIFPVDPSVMFRFHLIRQTARRDAFGYVLDCARERRTERAA